MVAPTGKRRFFFVAWCSWWQDVEAEATTVTDKSPRRRSPPNVDPALVAKKSPHDDGARQEHGHFRVGGHADTKRVASPEGLRLGGDAALASLGSVVYDVAAAWHSEWRFEDAACHWKHCSVESRLGTSVDAGDCEHLEQYESHAPDVGAAWKPASTNQLWNGASFIC